MVFGTLRPLHGQWILLQLCPHSLLCLSQCFPCTQIEVKGGVSLLAEVAVWLYVGMLLLDALSHDFLHVVRAADCLHTMQEVATRGRDNLNPCP